MRLPFLTPLAAAALAASAAACTPNYKTTTTDSTTANAAATTDTVGARNQLAKDRAGVQLDSATTRTTDATGGAATDAASNPGQPK